ncbi:hydroxymethylglutaryl-coenzyme A reductase domain-containing protein [Ditylenchus destructor]|nr:hydroxymethylglutaryl-coenzyme A reductase domain-containing protein [Ditylenchus destructor]
MIFVSLVCRLACEQSRIEQWEVAWPNNAAYLLLSSFFDPTLGYSAVTFTMTIQDPQQFVAELKERVSKVITWAEPQNARWDDKLALELEELMQKYWPKPRSATFSLGDDPPPAPESNLVDVEVQTDAGFILDPRIVHPNMPSAQPNTTPAQPQQSQLSAKDEAILAELRSGKLKHRELEKQKDMGSHKAVELRRHYIEEMSKRRCLTDLPYVNYDYDLVNGACCENIIGYVPIPTGVAGPLIVHHGDQDQTEAYYVPMSTTEGALIASTNRGCKAINGSGGVTSIVINDGMSRAPVLKFQTVSDAHKCIKWVDANFDKIKAVFESTSSFVKLLKIEPFLDGIRLYLRFVASTGDAMGMNMVTKAATEAIELVQKQFPSSVQDSISGNMCVDKKASSLNWILGRGKSVVAEAIITADVVKDVLGTSVDKMVDLAASKLLIGALNSVSIGGANAHAANMVAAIFLATGQDAAQIVSSSMCSTQLSRTALGDLQISCTMNCLEVGTVGGGTILSPQGACLEMLRCNGSVPGAPGKNARKLAEVICSTVLAGELSLLASQCTGDLVRSHLRLNRSSKNLSSRALISIPEEIPSGPRSNLTVPPVLPNRPRSSSKRLSETVKKSASMCDQSFH